MDVAHNPDAALQLHEFLKTLPQVEQTIAVFAVMSDKDCRDMISLLENDVDFWCLPNGIGGERGQDPQKLSDYLGDNSRVFESFDESLSCAGSFKWGRSSACVWFFFHGGSGYRCAATSTLRYGRRSRCLSSGSLAS